MSKRKLSPQGERALAADLAAIRQNDHPEMATTRAPWTAPQNAEMVDLVFRAHRARLGNGGKLPHGWAADNGRTTLAMVNMLGPNRTSLRANGKPRSDWYNFKVGNINAILTELRRPEFRWTGIPDYRHTQTENRDPMIDALLWRAIDTEIRREDARRSFLEASYK